MINRTRVIIRKIIPFKIRKFGKKCILYIDTIVNKKVYYHKEIYYKCKNKVLNIDNPRTFDEKIQWLILNKYGRFEAKLTDKIYVKQYVEKKKIRDLYIPKVLKIYKDVKDIDLESLPDKFVLKCNHWSGDVFICNEKNKFDIDMAKNRLGIVKKSDFSKIWGEYHYHYIKPKIFAEEYLEDKVNKNPIDYKFYCVNGTVKSILVCMDRDTSLKLSEYDLQWHRIDCIKKEFKQTKRMPKPGNLDKMVHIAEQLSNGIPFVRVDLYCINNRIYFGEYTFTPAAGMSGTLTDYGQLLHGDYIDI